MDLVYEKNFQTLCSNPFFTIIAHRYHGQPIDKIIEHIYEELIEFESNYLLSGKSCIVYPNITSQIAIKQYACNLSIDSILKGEHYLRFNPLIIATYEPENYKSYETYVLKRPIICRESFYNDLPQDISDLDDFACHAESGYNTDCYPNINFSHFYDQIGGAFVLKRIR
ncbi:MAG: hypothetical protein J5892_04045 [Bacilli bacterium]|nr:hypothetical protein [Bacilli bacterium]